MGMDSKLLEKLAALAPMKKISCPRALALANEVGVSPAKIGEAANQLGIKVIGCQLGCFGKMKKGEEG
jgi:hypothetical protein